MEYVKLGNYINIKTGKLDANKNTVNGKYPFFTCSKVTLRINTYSYDCECVLVAGNGEINAKYYNGKFDAYQRTYIIESKDKSKLLVKYIYYFMLSYIDILKRKSIGGVIKYIKLNNLTEAIIPLISIAEQKKIINYFEKYNKYVDYNKILLNDLDNIVKSRFIKMFGDPIQNEKAWNSSILNEVTDVRDGTHDSPKYHDRGYPFVTSKNLIDGKIDFSTCQFISEKDYLHFNDRSRIDDGDILMPMIGTIGGAIIVKKDREFSIKNVALIKFTKDNTKINRTFILYILNSDSMNNYFELTKKGGTQKFMALGVIRNIPIIVPPIELQNEFAKFVNQIDKSKFIIQKQIKLLEELLEKKMNEYFGD